jgi:DNA-binding response OmpR family regulator
MQKRILVVAHDEILRSTRALLLLKSGYAVATVETPDAAMALLERNVFDLVLIGRKSLRPGKGIDQRLREAYPALLILKIAEILEEHSPYPSRITDSVPGNVIASVKAMLGEAPE